MSHSQRPPFLLPADRPVSRQTRDFRRMLVEPWEYTYHHDRVTDVIRLEAGTVYAPSVPGVAHSLVRVEQLMVASAPHDAIYRARGRSDHVWRRQPDGSFDPITVDRRYADRLFRHLLHAVRVPLWRIRLAYLGVRSPIGWYTWITD